MTQSQEDFLWDLARSSEWSTDLVQELVDHFPEVDWRAREVEEERKLIESRKEWREAHPEEAQRIAELNGFFIKAYAPLLRRVLERESPFLGKVNK